MRQHEDRPEIMVVDDDPDTLLVLARHIKREGYAVREACSGAECLRLAKAQPPDVILMDLMMPEMDGFAVCRALRADSVTAEIPVIMLTACDDVEAKAEGMQVGVSDFIAKPVVRRELAERIQMQLEMIAAGRTNFATLDSLNHRALDRGEKE
jgi:DNA-binding response OmpR family regulator